MTLSRLILAASITCLVPEQPIGPSPCKPAPRHCDGLDGPVVKAAQAALATANVDLVLAWVKPEAEAEIREAFARALEVRRLGPAAAQLADRFLFETLVRVHRTGEGAPFTGLKPAGRDLGPAIPAVDKALEEHSIAELETLLVDAVKSSLHERYEEAIDAKAHASDGVAAGRKYVESYVEFVHFAVRVHHAATGPMNGHASDEEHE